MLLLAGAITALFLVGVGLVALTETVLRPETPEQALGLGGLGLQLQTGFAQSRFITRFGQPLANFTGQTKTIHNI